MAKILIPLVVWCLAVAHGSSFFWRGPFSRSTNGERIVASPMTPALMPCTHGYASSMVAQGPAYPSRYPVSQSSLMPSAYPLVYYIQPPDIMNSAPIPGVAAAAAANTNNGDIASTTIVEPANKPVPTSGAEELQYTYTRPVAATAMTGADALLYSNPAQRPVSMTPAMTPMTGTEDSIMYGPTTYAANRPPLAVSEELQYHYNPAPTPARPVVAMTGAPDSTFGYYGNTAWVRPAAAETSSYMYTNAASRPVAAMTGVDAASYMYTNTASRPVTAMTGADSASALLYQNPMSPGFASSSMTAEKQKPSAATTVTVSTVQPVTSTSSGTTVKHPPSASGTFPGITVPSFPTNTWQNYLCNVFPYLPSCSQNGTDQASTPNILSHGYTVQPTATTLVTTHQMPTGPAGPITPVAYYPPSSATSMYPYGYSPYYTQMAQNPVYYYVQPELRPVDNQFPGVASSMGTIKVIGPQTFRPEQVPIHMQDSIRPVGPKPVDPDSMTLAEAKTQGDQPSHLDNLEDIETQDGQSITYSKTPSTG